MSARAVPVVKSVPMCMAPISVTAAVAFNSVTLMGFHVKVSSIVLQTEVSEHFMVSL